MKILRFVWLFFCLSIFLFVFFVIALWFSARIPNFWVLRNINQTVRVLKPEGLYPSVGFPWRRVVLDNFTDGVMLNIAYSMDSSHPMRSAIRTVQFDSDDNSADQIHNLEKLALQKGVHETVYERYWHGYVIFLRPLLALGSYGFVRLVYMIVLFGVCDFFLFSVWKHLGIRYAVAFLFGLIVVDFFWVGKSIQLTNVFLTGMVGSLFLLQNKAVPFIKVGIIFFVVGACTSYIDVLSTPLVSLALLLVTSIGLMQLFDLRKLFLLCVLWSIGYLGLWGAKWVLAEFTYVPGAITSGYQKVQDRTHGAVDAQFTRKETIKRNVYQLRGYDKRNKIIDLVLGLCYVSFIVTHLSLRTVSWRRVGVWLCLAVIPYIWYDIAAEHSYIHVVFTYRAQFLTVVSAFLISTEFVDWKKVKKELLFWKQKEASF